MMGTIPFNGKRSFVFNVNGILIFVCLRIRYILIGCKIDCMGNELVYASANVYDFLCLQLESTGIARSKYILFSLGCENILLNFLLPYVFYFIVTVTTYHKVPYSSFVYHRALQKLFEKAHASSM